MEVKSFILGKDAVPEWFNESAKQGRAKLIYDPDDQSELLGATIFAPTKNFHVNLGDTIMKSRSSIIAIPKEKAAKYMGLGKKTNAEVKQGKEKENE